MAATQEALYGGLDLALSWSESDLPERERTKHVHRLHPYLGKFIPQLVEAMLERYVPPGGRVLDPVRRLRHDARAGARIGLRRDRSRHRRLQRAADAREDPAVQPRRPPARSPLRSRPGRGVLSARTLSRRRDPLCPRLVRSGRGRGAPPLSLADRRGGPSGCPPRRAGAGSALRSPHGPLRPRVPARPADGRVLVSQAPPALPARGRGAPVPASLHDRHARPDRGVLGRSRSRADRGDPARGRARARPAGAL